MQHKYIGLVVVQGSDSVIEGAMAVAPVTTCEKDARARAKDLARITKTKVGEKLYADAAVIVHHDNLQHYETSKSDVGT